MKPLAAFLGRRVNQPGIEGGKNRPKSNLLSPTLVCMR